MSHTESDEENRLDADDELICEEDILEVVDLGDDIPPEPEAYKNGADEPDDLVHSAMETEEEEAPVVTDAPALSFKQHSGNVFSVDVFDAMAASGGEDDKAFLWNVQTGEVILTCDGHLDSVTWTRFNSKGSLLATGDMSGLIQIWNTSSRSLQTQFECGDLEWLQWHYVADILLAGTKSGSIFMWLVPSMECKVYSGPAVSCTAGMLLRSGKDVCVGHENGAVYCHNLRAMSSIPVQLPKNEIAPVTAIAVSPDGFIGACGLSSGRCHLFLTATGKFLSSLQCFVPSVTASADATAGANGSVEGTEEDDEKESLRSVEAVAFCDVAPNLFCTGTVNGDVFIWDTNTLTQRHKLPHPDGIVKVLWIDLCVLTGGLDGIVRSFDSRSGALLRSFGAHSGEILDFSVSLDRSVLVTAAADNVCNVYRFN